MKLENELRLRLAAVWACRIVAGAAFIVSGWAKAVDPWGFVIKTGEYLSVWGWRVPHEAVVAGCVALACVEFAVGVLLLTGSLKRTAALAATAMMAFMLPLTAYIVIADPVSDCGCFGDLWHVSNGFTFFKNIVLSAAAVYLLMRNRTVPGIYAAPVQWLVVAVSLGFPLFLAIYGYQVQPLVDFRPYKAGTPVFQGNAGVDNSGGFIYEKDGIRREFSLDEIPDTTWTFVDAVQPNEGDRSFGGVISVRDDRGNEVNDMIVNDRGRNMYLIVPDPDMHYLVQAHFLNRLAAWCEKSNVDFCAVIGARGVETDRWKDWIRPSFDVYLADASALKQMVRGREAIVYAVDGVVVWKRTLSSVSRELPSGGLSAADMVDAPDNGYMHGYALSIYLAVMCVVYLLSLSPRILSLLTKFAGRLK